MTTRRAMFSWWPPAGNRLAPGALDKLAGTTTTFRLSSGEGWPARVVAAAVADDGWSAMLTVDVEVPEGRELVPGERALAETHRLTAPPPPQLAASRLADDDPAFRSLLDRLGLDDEEAGHA